MTTRRSVRFLRLKQEICVRSMGLFRYFRSRIAAVSKPDVVHLLAILSSESDRSLFQLAASQRINWETTVVGSWDEAASLLEIERFAVIVYDRDLPDRDWRQTVRNLAKLSPCILLASTRIDGFLWQEVVQCGGHDVFTKPLEERSVFRTIDQALRYTAATANTSAKR